MYVFVSTYKYSRVFYYLQGLYTVYYNPGQVLPNTNNKKTVEIFEYS